ncbi:DamX-like protein [Legionella beliardensis]|uniref:DamX-like protein n=1 Tax=Legionella beliardensis TaxID=91822 RepID=A0A378HZB7_9GAMM|nr:ATP-binding protein [Legionella beliardensis]STX28257.1 DamX-like protein [Legionella beliardensis]
MLSSSNAAISPTESVNTLLYKPNNWLAKINFINHLILFNDLMIVVMAEQGGGKTAFIQLLQEGLSAEISAYTVDAKVPLAEAQTLTQIEKFCHLPASSEPQLSDLVEKINTLKKHILIIIDNAHCLREDFLKNLLHEVKKYRNNFFHVCLASDFSLNPLLNVLHGDTFKDLIHTIDLGLLSKQETKEYLLKKLPVSTKGLNKQLTDKILNEFYDLTSGCIAQINTHLASFFNLNKTNYSFLTKRLPVITSLFLLLLAMTYLGQAKIKSNSPAASYADLTKGNGTIKSNLIRHNDIKLDSKLLAIPINHEQESLPLQEERTKTVTATALDQHHQEFVTVNESTIASAIFPEEIAETVLESSLLAIDEVFKQSNLAKTTAEQQLENFYTIQLLAGADKEGLNHFLRKQPIQGTTINHLKRRGKDWFVLTLGEYSQSNQAKIALQQLPPELRKLKPWVRALPRK